MRRVLLLTLIFLFLISSNVNAKYDDMILRNIITDVVWNAGEEQIEVHYIVIQFVPNQGVNTYPAMTSMHHDDWGVGEMTNEKAKEIAREYSSKFKDDYIFGKQVAAYKDMTNHAFTENELEEIIEEAQREVKALSEAGPENISEDGSIIDPTENIKIDSEENEANSGINSPVNQVTKDTTPANISVTNNESGDYWKYWTGLVVVVVLLVLAKIVFKFWRK